MKEKSKGTKMKLKLIRWRLKIITCFPAGLQRPHCLVVLFSLILSNLTDVRVVHCIVCAFHPTCNRRYKNIWSTYHIWLLVIVLPSATIIHIHPLNPRLQILCFPPYSRSHWP